MIEYPGIELPYIVEMKKGKNNIFKLQ